MATDCQRTCDVLWFERTYLEYVKSIFQFYLKTLEKMACAEAEANAAVAEKLTTDGGGLNGLIEDDDCSLAKIHYLHIEEVYEGSWRGD